MAWLKKIKKTTQIRLMKSFLKGLFRMSEKNLIRATYLAEKLTVDKEKKGIVRILRKFFKQGHPFLKLIKRTQTELNPNCLNKLIENFFINACLLYDERKNEVESKEGIHVPFFLLMSPTMKCNLRCKGCSIQAYDAKEDLPAEVVNRVLDEAKELGIYFVTILGGETFIRPDMLDFYQRHNDMYFQVYSNGTLIDKAMAKKLAELGNVEVNLSVEGFEKETDERRGKGVWNKVMQAMDNLREAGVLFGFSVTQTRFNTDIVTSDEFFDKMIDKGCYIGWFFQCIPLGNNPDLNLLPLPEQRNKLRKKLKEVRATKPLFLGDFWNDGPYVKGCMAGGQNYLHINNRGDVEPCGFVHFAVDNIKNKSLKEVLMSPFFRAMRQRIQNIEAPKAYSDNLLTPCQIIDQPWVLRGLVKEFNAYSTDGAGDVLLKGKVAHALDNYSKKIHQLYDKIWETDYKNKKR